MRVRQRKHADREHLSYCSTECTAQRNQPPKRHIRADQSATTQASTELVRASTCRRALVQYAESSKRTKKSKYARPTIICNYSHSAGVMREGFASSFDLKNIQHCSFSVLFQCISSMHAASGFLSWSMELLAFANRHFAPTIVDLSVRFIRIFFWPSLRARAAGGGSRPRSEASCT